MRLTRDQASGRVQATNSRDYQHVGRQVNQSLAFTYFYPAIKTEEDYQVVWFWPERTSFFKQTFLSSSSGTALSYPHQSAAVGMLHEVEFISPKTADTGEPVFLIGYVFERNDVQLGWRAACRRLQIGGERGYGWGDIELINLCEINDNKLFEGKVMFKGGSDRPVIHLPTNEDTPGRLLAHALAENLPASGDVEPLVGREWRSDALHHRYAGQYVVFNGICFAPGSTISREIDFEVGPFGLWRMVE